MCVLVSWKEGHTEEGLETQKPAKRDTLSQKEKQKNSGFLTDTWSHDTTVKRRRIQAKLQVELTAWQCRQRGIVNMTNLTVVSSLEVTLFKLLTRVKRGGREGEGERREVV